MDWKPGMIVKNVTERVRGMLGLGTPFLPTNWEFFERPPQVWKSRNLGISPHFANKYDPYLPYRSSLAVKRFAFPAEVSKYRRRRNA